MTRRAGGSAQNAVSLFPFLAVLLCTMGSLILLLIVIARQARDQRDDAHHGNVPPSDVAEAAQRRDDLNWRIERLAESHRKTAEQLAEQRATLSHLEEHAQRLRGELAEGENARRLLTGKKSIDEAERARLLADIEELRRQAAEVETKLAEENAAGRRPPAFAVLPYDGENGTRRRPIYVECRGDGIILQPEGIVFRESDFAGSLGPSNALAACLRVISEHYARAGGLQAHDQPYPLLLVRPDGIGAYYAARAAMSSWDSDFGYELIEADWPLEFPPADPQLAQLLARTQDEARRRQVLIARAAPTLRSSTSPSFDMTGEGSGDGDARGPSGRYGGPTGTGGGNDAGRYGGGADGLRSVGGGGAYDPPATANGTGTAAGAGLGNQLGNSHGSNPNGQGPGNGGGFGAAGGDGGPQLIASGQAAPGGGAPPTGSGDVANGGGTGSPGGRTAGSPNGAAGGATGSSGGAPGSAGGEASQVGSGGGLPSYSFGAQPPPAGTTTDMNQPSRRNVESLAGKRGKNWGLPESAQKATGLTRPVQVYCSADRLTILSDRGVPDRQINLGPRTEDSVDELVAVVRSQIDTWGLAGRNMYWKPVLSLHVAPDGVERFQELRTLLAGSGLDVTGKPITVSTPTTTARRP